MERYFRVSPPATHDMIKTLERNGLIARTPGQARSIRLLVRREHLPASLIQGLRDFFGAHTYRRADRDGTFHTLWAQDRSEEAR